MTWLARRVNPARPGQKLGCNPLIFIFDFLLKQRRFDFLLKQRHFDFFKKNNPDNSIKT